MDSFWEGKSFHPSDTGKSFGTSPDKWNFCNMFMHSHLHHNDGLIISKKMWVMTSDFSPRNRAREAFASRRDALGWRSPLNFPKPAGPNHGWHLRRDFIKEAGQIPNRVARAASTGFISSAVSVPSRRSNLTVETV